MNLRAVREIRGKDENAILAGKEYKDCSSRLYRPMPSCNEAIGQASVQGGGAAKREMPAKRPRYR